MYSRYRYTVYVCPANLSRNKYYFTYFGITYTLGIRTDRTIIIFLFLTSVSLLINEYTGIRKQVRFIGNLEIHQLEKHKLERHKLEGQKLEP